MPNHRDLPLISQFVSRPVVLVAGGAGFIGSHICEKLLASCDVICIDNLTHGTRVNIASCLTSPHFSFLQYDVARPIADLVRKRVQYVIHVAGVDEVKRHEHAQLENLLLNTQGTRYLLEKALKDKAEFLLISTLDHHKQVDEFISAAQARLFAESLTKEYVAKFGVRARIVRLGEVFGPRMPLDLQTPLSQLLHGALHQKAVTLPLAKTTPTNPLYIDMAIAWLLQLLFDTKSRGRVFNLAAQTAFQVGSIAKILHDLVPSFQPRFHAQPTTQTAKEDDGEVVLLSGETEKHLRSQLHATLASLSSKQPPPPTFTEHVVTKARMTLRKLLGLTVVFLFLGTTLLPAVLFGITAAVGAYTLQQAATSLEAGKIAEAKQEAMYSRQFFFSSHLFLNVLTPTFFVLGKSDEHRAYLQLTTIGQTGADTTIHLSQAATSLGNVVRQSFKGGEGDLSGVMQQAISEVNAVVGEVSFLQSELQQLENKPLPGLITSQLSKRKALLTEYKETLTLAQTFVTLLPDVLGFSDKRTYLLLLQNNMELRPGGGFIGSYGVLSFDNGKLTNFEIQDVYSADGQLKGHIDPPLPIRTHLNQPNWFLRDSNWDPDFQKSASQAAWFLEKEIGQKTDGVIAMDVTQMQLLLSAMGPISLPDYKETVTSSNVFEKMEAHAEENFFPGSTQKKDFLGAVSRRVLDRMLHEEDMSWLKLMTAFKKGVGEKHILFAFTSPSVENVVKVNNWGGSILNLPSDNDRLSDYRMLSEANVGLNKVNAFIKRKVSDTIAISEEGSMSGTLRITYNNPHDAKWPGGEYKNYLRVLFPLNTTISAVSIDNQEVYRKGEKGSLTLDISSATESGKTVVGLLHTTPATKTSTIAIRYDLPQVFPKAPGSTTYNYVFQKQPGTNEDPLEVAIHFPSTLSMTSTNAKVFQDKNLVSLSSSLAEDRLFSVEFLR